MLIEKNECLNQDKSVAHQRLVQRVVMAGSRSWLEGYLNLVKLLLEDLAMESSDPRLAMTIPKGSGGWFLPISINNRYVVAPQTKKNKENLIGIIFGSDFEGLPGLRAKVVHYSRFKTLSGENSEEIPFFLRFRSADEVLQDELRLGWLKAARREVERARASPYRRHHEPAFYRLVADLAYRQSILDQVFSPIPSEHPYLEQLPPENDEPPTPTSIDIDAPNRKDTTVSRIIRDSALAKRIKRLHNYEFQLCGHTILLPNGSRYAEAHHIQPLGGKYNGLDKPENLLCVCPNHHAELDFAAIPLDLAQLRQVKKHKIDEKYIYHHNKLHEERKKI